MYLLIKIDLLFYHDTVTAGVSEDIRLACRRYGMQVIFRSWRLLRSGLSKVKDPLLMEKQSKVVYRIPCSCGKSYIGWTKRGFETILKEH